MGKVVTEIRGAVAIVSFENEGRLNAIDPEIAGGLAQTAAALAQRSDVGALILRGAGTRAFCAGNDLKFLAQAPSRDAGFAALTPRIDALRATMAELPFPTVAMLHGICYGAGVNLALMADFRLGDSALKVAIPALKNARYYPPAGIQQVMRMFGSANAWRMLVAAEALPAETALACGFVQQVCPPQQLEAVTLEYATRLAARPRAMIPAYVKIMRAVERGDLELATRLREQAISAAAPAKPAR
jgi:enoyl-CoA hydratase